MTYYAYNSGLTETRKLVQICGFSPVRPGGKFLKLVWTSIQKIVIIKVRLLKM